VAVSEPYGTTTGNRLQGPTAVKRHTLRSPSGLRVELLGLGATVARVEIPDGAGGVVPLCLDLDTLADREDPVRNPYLGVTVGRWANRLRDSRFVIDDHEFPVEANEGVHQLHGGPIGFSHVVWDADTTDTSVTFRRTSPAGEMGFPGTLDVTVTHELTERTLRITYEATTDAPTIVSLTNHTYWNLGGPDEDDIGAHTVQLDADLVVPIDHDTLPSGEPEPVADTIFDLRMPTRLSDRIGFSLPNGYDHCFMIRGEGFRRHARVTHPPTGRSVEIWSDRPASQLYTGVYLGGGPGADHRTHDPFAALCIEPQHVPDAPNLAWAPSPVLRPGEHDRHRLEFRFDWG
jgi:aldose 1-epimerase